MFVQDYVLYNVHMSSVWVLENMEDISKRLLFLVEKDFMLILENDSMFSGKREGRTMENNMEEKSLMKTNSL